MLLYFIFYFYFNDFFSIKYFFEIIIKHEMHEYEYRIIFTCVIFFQLHLNFCQNFYNEFEKRQCVFILLYEFIYSEFLEIENIIT